jgi:hypothetical protein
MRHLAIRNPQRDNDAAIFYRLTVDFGLMLVHVAAEQPMPEARARKRRV